MGNRVTGRVWHLTMRAPATVRRGRPAPGWLTMNDRDNRWDHARLVKQWRELATWAARTEHLPVGDVKRARVDVLLAFSAPARRDPPNWHPTAKAILDALTRGTAKHPGYGFLPDDSPQFMHCQQCPHITISDQRLAPAPWGPTGEVVVTLTELEP